MPTPYARVSLKGRQDLTGRSLGPSAAWLLSCAGARRMTGRLVCLGSRDSRSLRRIPSRGVRAQDGVGVASVGAPRQAVSPGFEKGFPQVIVLGLGVGSPHALSGRTWDWNQGPPECEMFRGLDGTRYDWIAWLTQITGGRRTPLNPVRRGCAALALPWGDLPGSIHVGYGRLRLQHSPMNPSHRIRRLRWSYGRRPRHTHDVVGKRRKHHTASRGPAGHDVLRARESSRNAGLQDRRLGVGTQANGLLGGARTIDDRGDDHYRWDLCAHWLGPRSDDRKPTPSRAHCTDRVRSQQPRVALAPIAVSSSTLDVRRRASWARGPIGQHLTVSLPKRT